MPSILDYLRQPQGALSSALGDQSEHQRQLQMLRAMTPEQRAQASLREQEIQRRSAVLGQRGPTHYSGIPTTIQAQPQGWIGAKLAEWGQGVQGRVREMAGALDPRAWPEAIRTLPDPRVLMNQQMSPEQQQQVGMQGLNRAMNMGPGALGKLAPALVGAVMPGIKGLQAAVWRGGKSAADGQFFSRDAQYAKGFDKGDYRQYQINADSALNLGATYGAKKLEPVLRELDRMGDTQAAEQIRAALSEDGGAIGGHLYAWLERLGKHSPEEVLRRAGFDAIDTGRDIRVLNPGAISP